MKKIFLVMLVFASSMAFADRVKLLVNDKEALQARLDLIRGAKKQIRAEYFYVGDDSTSYCGLALLQQAARQGKDVRVIIDAGFSKISRPTLLALTTDAQSQGRLQIKFFNQHDARDPSTFDHRLHDKQLNIDGKVFITGGRNVGDDYFGFNKEKNFVDLDILVAGPQAEVASRYFDNLWTINPNVTPPKFVRTRYETENAETAQKRLDQTLLSLENGEYAANLTRPTDWVSLAQEHSGVEFVYDSPFFKVNDAHHDVSDRLYKMGTTRAKKSLTIVTPYLILNPVSRQAFKNLLAGGTHINILTNSLRSTDAYEAQAGYRNVQDELTNMGIEIWEYNGPNTVHAKSGVLEDLDGTKVAWVGSFNLDPRSSRLNREIGVFVDNRADSSFADELLKTIAALRANAMIVAKDGKELNKEHKFDGVSNEDIAKVRALQILFKRVPFFRDET